MEGPFQALRTVLVNHISHVEAECNVLMRSMRAENDDLRNKLLEAQAMPSKKIIESNGLKLLESQSLSECLQSFPVEFGGRLYTPRPFLNSRSRPDRSAEQFRSASQRLCVTPGRSMTPGRTNGIEDGPHALQLPWQSSPHDGSNAVVATGAVASFGGSGGVWPQAAGAVTPGRMNEIDHTQQAMPWQPLPDTPMKWSQADDHQLLEESSPELMGGHSTISLPETFLTDNMVNNRWALLFAGITIPKQSRKWLTGISQVRNLQLQPLWEVSAPAPSGPVRVSSERAILVSDRLKSRSSQQGHDIRVGSILRNHGSWLQSCTIHPEHKFGMAHALMQCALILFDVLDFPMSAFYSDSPFGDVMLMVSAIFWTWDLLFSFLKGYHSADGVIEMRPSRIARHYMRGWFIFDFVIVAFDWVALIIFILEEASSKESKIVRSTKLRRLQRFARGGRILRFFKAIEQVTSFLDAVASEEGIVTVTRIFFLLCLIFLINHYVACAWYGIAESNTREFTWLMQQNLDPNEEIYDKYLYSLHWSLTQFTPCTNNIGPQNTTERLFASVVAIFALVIFSTFLSSLTTAIMQIKRLNYERYNEQMQIRDFLYSKEVPLEVANRIWHYYRTHYRRRSRTVSEKDIHLFRVLPKSLRKELHIHSYVPTLANHPVLKVVADDSQLVPLGPFLCELTSTLIPVSGQDIFLEGEMAHHMYFFVQGSGTYVFFGQEQTVQAPDYITEPVLWLRDWQHLGRLSVTDHRCELLLLCAAGFLSCIEKEAPTITLRSLRKYASLFAQHLADMEVDSIVQTRSCYVPIGVGGATLRIPRGEMQLTRCTDLALDRDVVQELQNASFPVDYTLTESRTSSGFAFPVEEVTQAISAIDRCVHYMWSKCRRRAR